MATAPQTRKSIIGTPAPRGGLDWLMADLGVRSDRVYDGLIDVDQSDTNAVEEAIRTTLVAAHYGSVACYAGLLASLVADERDAAIIEGKALAGAAVKSLHYGYGKVLFTYRNSGSLGGWRYRVRFDGDRIITVDAETVAWVGGIKADQAAHSYAEAAE